MHVAVTCSEFLHNSDQHLAKHFRILALTKVHFTKSFSRKSIANLLIGYNVKKNMEASCKQNSSVLGTLCKHLQNIVNMAALVRNLLKMHTCLDKQTKSA